MIYIVQTEKNKWLASWLDAYGKQGQSVSKDGAKRFVTRELAEKAMGLVEKQQAINTAEIITEGF